MHCVLWRNLWTVAYTGGNIESVALECLNCGPLFYVWSVGLQCTGMFNMGSVLSWHIWSFACIVQYCAGVSQLWACTMQEYLNSGLFWQDCCTLGLYCTGMSELSTCTAQKCFNSGLYPKGMFKLWAYCGPVLYCTDVQECLNCGSVLYRNI